MSDQNRSVVSLRSTTHFDNVDPVRGIPANSRPIRIVYEQLQASVEPKTDSECRVDKQEDCCEEKSPLYFLSASPTAIDSG